MALSPTSVSASVHLGAARIPLDQPIDLRQRAGSLLIAGLDATDAYLGSCQEPEDRKFPILNISVVWSSFIEAPVSGTYTIFGTTDHGMQIFIGGVAVVDSFFFQGPTEHPGTIDLVAGVRYLLKIRWFQGGSQAEAHVWWQPPGGVKTVVPTERLYPVH